MLNEQELLELVSAGVLTPAGINFRILQENYPWLIEKALATVLTDLEFAVWKAGYMHYSIGLDGNLIWKLTPAGVLLVATIDDILGGRN